ncbi:Pre-mRNA-splicing factor 38 [Fusarium oxysporum f. sp. albedinis]|nr:Pre-mRNA-splicing factor 38 [Fusarium oxysporum f. sp. albedinis]
MYLYHSTRPRLRLAKAAKRHAREAAIEREDACNRDKMMSRKENVAVHRVDDDDIDYQWGRTEIKIEASRSNTGGL